MRFRFDEIDQWIARHMKQWGLPAIRISFGVIFFLFGILKPLGLSPAAPLLMKTVVWLPVGSPKTWLLIIGWWEVLIGVTFLFRKTIRIAIGLLFLHMIGTFMPFIFLPEVVYQNAGKVYLPTMEGQYIIKNLMIIAAALVVGGTKCKDPV